MIIAEELRIQIWLRREPLRSLDELLPFADWLAAARFWDAVDEFLEWADYGRRKGLLTTFEWSRETDAARAIQKRRDDARLDLGVCLGCHGYGQLGASCVRKLNGRLEECGQYV